ncbi:MAG: bifunctional phosphoribosylaminoimidazolecarboxamide formyltransferase/inosine monophosphate cyclohydrolase [Thermoplasmata archaeon]|nr:bifunctional phosphoribosylaminoimidazolecarboxamide formyltransferase/inosine monophosphate cyclohydrolase [Thermoplasmata archaeon]|tara:strand:- start:2965 stop:4623 length:1659 start_codon:yes stop_codon:yes gene_type:complete
MDDFKQPGTISEVPNKTGQNAPRALISVYDKSGITALAVALEAMGWQILSTGGTARLLRDSGVNVTDVSSVTGHPEVFDGRVKTLHPAIHAPILARGKNKDDVSVLASLGYSRIDMVVVNLYPFEEIAAKKPPVNMDELIEMIDIGGPTLVRASAKNHADVLVLSNPNQYEKILDCLQETNGDPESVSLEIRQRLALSAFHRTAAYDVALSNTLSERFAEINTNELPNKLLISGGELNKLRYGENPHQLAGFYDSTRKGEEKKGLAAAKQHGGKELSFNNYLDLEAAMRYARSLTGDEWEKWPHCCVIIKHTNACGVALSNNQLDAWKDALASDPESAFGCVIAFNKIVTLDVAEEMGNHFVECIIAPGYDADALEYLSEKKNRRMLTLTDFQPLDAELRWRQIDGGWLAQSEGAPIIDWENVNCVTNKKAKQGVVNLARFGVAVCAQVKSNCVIFVQPTETGFATVGIGPGQTSRVEAVRIAARRAGDRAQGAMMISDAFFPFRDGIDASHEIGITSVVQPGGSIRDQEVIDAANEHEMVMLFTGTRLFRH